MIGRRLSAVESAVIAVQRQVAPSSEGSAFEQLVVLLAVGGADQRHAGYRMNVRRDDDAARITGVERDEAGVEGLPSIQTRLPAGARKCERQVAPSNRRVPVVVASLCAMNRGDGVWAALPVDLEVDGPCSPFLADSPRTAS